MSIHTLDPQFRVPGFFTQENVNTISRLITETIGQSFSGKKVIVPDPHIVRFMQSIQEDRPEPIPKMNERVVIAIVRTFLDFVYENERNNNWSYFRYDAYNRGANLGIKPYDKPKLKGNFVGRQNTQRRFTFHFTY